MSFLLRGARHAPSPASGKPSATGSGMARDSATAASAGPSGTEAGTAPFGFARRSFGPCAAARLSRASLQGAPSQVGAMGVAGERAPGM